jgi:hypothetical protein
VIDPEASVLNVLNTTATIVGMVISFLKEEVGGKGAVDIRMNRAWIEKGLEEKVGEKTKHFGVRLARIELVEARELKIHSGIYFVEH